MKGHPERARDFIDNSGKSAWHDNALWYVREKRDTAVHTLPEWEALREHAAQIKAHTISNIDNYLEEFEANCIENNITVHWAETDVDMREIVLKIVQSQKATKIVKSKSMLTEECGLNLLLEKHGIEVIDTDLGERIVQLREEHPSHIVLPAIHTKREEISELFHEKLGTEEGNIDPEYLTRAARKALRQDFLDGEIGITGVNFAIAETGGITVCTNEGNADLGTSLPPVHIACMGMEKLIPKANDLGVFTRVLARSATGQAITTYTSHFHGPRQGGEMHIVIVDNKRSKILAEDDFRRALSCIRCGACMNTCPVYRRSGGHSYDATIPGQIGSILSPHLNDTKNASLPFASTLCGSCTDVCPVKINIHEQLLTWRNKLGDEHKIGLLKRLSMKAGGIVLASPFLYKLSGVGLKIVGKISPLYNNISPWSRQREMPVVPPKSFK